MRLFLTLGFLAAVVSANKWTLTPYIGEGCAKHKDTASKSGDGPWGCTKLDSKQFRSFKSDADERGLQVVFYTNEDCKKEDDDHKQPQPQNMKATKVDGNCADIDVNHLIKKDFVAFEVIEGNDM